MNLPALFSIVEVMRAGRSTPPSAEASRLPSGLNTTEDTELVWPVRTARADWLSSTAMAARASLVWAMAWAAARRADVAGSSGRDWL
ncbi:hypothetical protein [Streptosporangium sp. 'caverna']|uniref:hypothetical protein n=1 Tax=Streptosporangium sp. 'caverna' TaxID=2202249 RepID=UPI0013A6CC4D|nr:hypothetical protein [Streptosporangium sp. 'caverna']